MNGAVLEVEGLVKLYGGRAAVEGLSFSASPGDILGLVGPNGAGKTTTMRTIAGVFPPSEGTVRVAGHDLRREPLEAKRRLALVPDDPSLFANLTVEEHLEFTAQVYGVADWRPRADGMLRDLELTDRADSPASDLSRGMRQKVAIACAFLHAPSLLMLDEPLTGLDPRGIRTLYDLLRRRAAEGAAVVVSSHLLGQIEGLCTRFLILRAGRRLFLGTKEEIRAQLPALRDDASLEEIFFRATEGGALGGDGAAAAPAATEASAAPEPPPPRDPDRDAAP